MKALRRTTSLIVLAGIVVIGLIFGERPSLRPSFVKVSVVRADEDTCSQASLHGTYAIHAQGTVVGQLPPPFPNAPFPFGEAGIITLNGKGQHSGKTTVNLGGVVLQPAFTGTYTVNPDCTGTITLESNAGFVLHDAIVVTRGGRATVEVETDPFTVITRTLEKIGD